MFDKNLVNAQKSQAGLTSQAMTAVTFKRSLILGICAFWSSKEDNSHFYLIFDLLISLDFPLSGEISSSSCIFSIDFTVHVLSSTFS